jgi:hypothetical protein
MKFSDMSERDFKKITDCARAYEKLKEGFDFADNCVRFFSFEKAIDGGYLEIMSPHHDPQRVGLYPDKEFLSEVDISLKKLKARYADQISRLSLEIGEETTFLPIGLGESTD